MEELAYQLDKINLEEDKNEEVVILGFMDRYDVSYKEAKDIFIETKKFLKLAADLQESGNGSIFIDQPLLIIDEMWHTFILHTRQYVNYCMREFKRFLHHVPTPGIEHDKLNMRLEENPLTVLKEHEAKLKIQYSHIFDKLGPETLVKWYDTMASKYTPEYLTKIKKAG